MIPIAINDVPVDCINRAAIIYKVPVTVILSIMKKENGKNGDAIRNKSNGSVDYGVMQINSVWLSKIKPYGYTKDDLQFNACKNVAVGAWIIGQNMARDKELWLGIAGYHSRTPVHNEPYKKSIYANYTKLVNAIST